MPSKAAPTVSPLSEHGETRPGNSSVWVILSAALGLDFAYMFCIWFSTRPHLWIWFSNYIFYISVLGSRAEGVIVHTRLESCHFIQNNSRWIEKKAQHWERLLFRTASPWHDVPRFFTHFPNNKWLYSTYKDHVLDGRCFISPKIVVFRLSSPFIWLIATDFCRFLTKLLTLFYPFSSVSS